MKNVVPALTVALFLAAGTARADIVSHNGTALTGGSGAANVDLFWVNTPGGLLIGTAWHEVTTHLLAYAYDDESEPPIFLAEFAISNETLTPWKRFQLLLVGADIYGSNGAVYGGQLARATDPVVFGGLGPEDVTLSVPTGTVVVSSSSIARDGNNAILDIHFSDYVDPGEAFGLAFHVNDVGQTDRSFLL